MAGHNKWSKIKHRKAVTDKEKSKTFSKYSKLISMESKKCDGDINSPSLKSAIQQAKAVNMPSANIERAVSKGKAGDKNNMESINYEAYGPGGVGIIINAITDNRNRTSAEIKHTLSKNACSMGTSGSVAWAFDMKTKEPKSKVKIDDEDKLKLENIVSSLLDLDDTQDVFTNEE